MMNRLILVLLLALAGCAEPAPAQAQRPVVPDGMNFAASTRGTVFYAVECNAWTRLSPANLRFFRTADEAYAAGLRPSTSPGCAPSSGSVLASGVVPGPEQAAGQCLVQRIVDGDTLVCEGGERIRLLLIDAPELSQGELGTRAQQALVQLAPARTALRVELDVQEWDRYGRILAYLWLEDGRMVNEELLREGVAVVSVYPPNVRHVDRLRATMHEAREAGVGLWATDAFQCSPRDHRAGRC